MSQVGSECRNVYDNEEKPSRVAGYMMQMGFVKSMVHSCITNYMPNNQFKRGELYSVINGMASTAVARRLQKNFRQAGLEITLEQWSVLYHLWKEDCLSQQELCNRTFRDKPSITRLIDNLEKQKLVKRLISTSRQLCRVVLEVDQPLTW